MHLAALPPTAPRRATSAANQKIPAAPARNQNVPNVPQPNGGSNFNYGSGNPLYLTVNAIDGEGAARAVAQTLNSQAARSTSALRNA